MKSVVYGGERGFSVVLLLLVSLFIIKTKVPFLKNITKMMYNLEEEKIECVLGNKDFGFWQGKKADNVGYGLIFL